MTGLISVITDFRTDHRVDLLKAIIEHHPSTIPKLREKLQKVFKNAATEQYWLVEPCFTISRDLIEAHLEMILEHVELPASTINTLLQIDRTSDILMNLFRKKILSE
jgi:hypothetical protein